jgi:dTDP-glucose 4,6-dehydratase
MKFFVAGGAGFIGSNFIRYMLSKYRDIKIINYDKLTYAGNLDNLRDVEKDPRYTFVKGDITDMAAVDSVMNGVTHIVNFAAETHVDKSIHEGSRPFVMANTVGVQTLLDAARKYNIEKYVQISTDEVYGSLEINDKKQFTEETPFAPNVPYAAAKAGGDMMCRAYFKTFGLPVVVSHCSNNYGPYQYPEKLIPFFISRAFENKQLPLYGDGLNVRDWLFVLDHCSAIDLMAMKGVPGEVYNIGGNNEKSNIEIAHLILKNLGKPESLLTFVADRPGHDRRYAIDASKIRRELGWKPAHTFEQAIPYTIKWYVENKQWIENIKKKAAEFNAHLK